jgi:hypothetical protein
MPISRRYRKRFHGQDRSRAQYANERSTRIRVSVAAQDLGTVKTIDATNFLLIHQLRPRLLHFVCCQLSRLRGSANAQLEVICLFDFLRLPLTSIVLELPEVVFFDIAPLSLVLFLYFALLAFWSPPCFLFSLECFLSPQAFINPDFVSFGAERQESTLASPTPES